jgi:hypothetical protein
VLEFGQDLVGGEWLGWTFQDEEWEVD